MLVVSDGIDDKDDAATKDCTLINDNSYEDEVLHYQPRYGISTAKQ